MAVHHFAKLRSRSRTNNAGHGEDQRAGPFDCARTGMAKEIGRRTGGYRDRAGADRNVRIGNADDIIEKRHRQDRSAAANQAKMREARDKTLAAPLLLLPSIQVNIRAGKLPPAKRTVCAI